MIRQISATAWQALVASKGSQQEQDNFLRAVDAYRNDWAGRKQALTAQYKDNLQDPAYLAAKAALQAEAEAQLLAHGYYEEVGQEQLNQIFQDKIVDAVKNRPAIILTIVTRITNYYRGQQGKDPLTEAQVRSRLLA